MITITCQRCQRPMEMHCCTTCGGAVDVAGVPIVEVFADTDARLEPEITHTRLHKGTVLAVLAIVRDVVRTRDPQLAEQLIPARCEAAVQDWSRNPT